jgi:hypothetical protein
VYSTPQSSPVAPLCMAQYTVQSCCPSRVQSSTVAHSRHQSLHSIVTVYRPVHRTVSSEGPNFILLAHATHAALLSVLAELNHHATHLFQLLLASHERLVDDSSRYDALWVGVLNGHDGRGSVAVVEK